MTRQVSGDLKMRLGGDIATGQEETVDGYVQYLDRGDSFMDLFSQTHKFQYVSFIVCQLYLL